MGFFDIPPPQGFTRETELVVIGSSVSPRYAPPQGKGGSVLPPGQKFWIDNIPNNMVDNLGNKLVFME